jgi:hypothetical protein
MPLCRNCEVYKARLHFRNIDHLIMQKSNILIWEFEHSIFFRISNLIVNRIVQLVGSGNTSLGFDYCNAAKAAHRLCTGSSHLRYHSNEKVQTEFSNDSESRSEFSSSFRNWNATLTGRTLWHRRTAASPLRYLYVERKKVTLFGWGCDRDFGSSGRCRPAVLSYSPFTKDYLFRI